MRVARNEKGMVLLVVLMVVALLAVLLTEFAFSTLVDLRLTETFRDSTRAYYLARGGVTVGRMLLKQDTNSYDAPQDPAEIWGQGLSNYPVGEGFITIKVADLGGRLSLNQLIDSQGNVNEVAKNRLLLLCELLGLKEPETITDSLIDWLDSDDQPRPSGAETSYYLRQDNPYPAKNGKLETMSELELIQGFDAASRNKLAEHITLYGDDTLNVNSVTPEVLAAVFAAGDTVSLNEAEAAAEVVITLREEGPVKDKNQIKALPELENLGYIVNTYLDVKSSYFNIQADAEVNDGIRTVTAVVNDKDQLLQQRVQ